MSTRSFGYWWGGSLVLGLALLALPLAEPGVAQDTATQQAALDNSVPQTFTALAANLSNIDVGPAAQTVQVEITRWSTDGERDRLLSTLKEKGPEALLSLLQKMPRVGYIRTPTSLGYDLRFARQTPYGDGGRRIFIATDRYISFWEVADMSRTREYPFTLIEMHLDNKGQGEGKLSLATKIISDGNEIVLENFASAPILLKAIKRQK
jgi:hypothetical protein